MTATVIIPTTGASGLRNSIESVLRQTYKTKCYVVVDGEQFSGKASVILSDYRGEGIKECYLPINVGAKIGRAHV